MQLLEKTSLKAHMLFQKEGLTLRVNGFIQKLASSRELAGEPLPGIPIIEIAGDYRVLIENHTCITEYSENRIRVQVKFGQVIVEGSNLVISKMAKEQLVISGCIGSVHLLRGC